VKKEEQMMRRLTGVLVLVFAFMAAAVPAAAQEKQPGRQPAPASKAGAALVDLNTATPAQLEALPGIGPRTAERIVEYRDKNGGFKKIEELMNVRGVGEKSFLKLKDLITVTPPKADRAAGSSGT
jgi:competence protein ComEA